MSSGEPTNSRSSSRSSSGRTIFKIVLSLLILFHLATVAILPNGSSIIARAVNRFLVPYANPLIFNRTWQFFSPGPMPSFYLEYNLVTNAGPAVDDERPGFVYPPHRVKSGLDDFYLRTLAGMRLMAIQPEVFEAYFIPFLCRMHPDAIEIDLRSVTEEIPPIEKADGFENFKEMSEKVTVPRKLYHCEGREFTESGEL